jgi:hypothetical protein
MRKMLLIGGLAAAASLLNGCMIISCEEHHAPRPPCVIYGPPCGVVEVVPVPPYEPRPYWHEHYYYYYGRRW